MKFLSSSVLWLQSLLLILGTAYIVWAFDEVVRAGGGFVPGFESIQSQRLFATLAPYFALPVGIIFSVLLRRSRKYAVAVFLPVITLAVVAAAARYFLVVVPDPIQDNFGARDFPYLGFLVLPSDKIPAGFQELSHHYTKQEYSVRLAKVLDDDRVDLEIIESPITQFSVTPLQLAKEFEYQGIIGHVYVGHDGKWGKTALNLIWLNPPRQRVAIYLEQRQGDDYAPDDLINILQSMELAKDR